MTKSHILGALLGSFVTTIILKRRLVQHMSNYSSALYEFPSLLGSQHDILPSYHASKMSPADRLLELSKGIAEPDQTAYHEYKSLFVGVLTCGKYLGTRATAINDTWGQLVPKIMYFGQPDRHYQGMDIKTLDGVDDSVYPPLQKSFKMLQYVCDNHIDEFKWFMRADDDVYVDVPALEKLLAQIDSNRMTYMGQPGMGWPGIRDKLGLEGHNFCMGGPGVLINRAALKALCPYIPQCLADVVSPEDDVEIGRCVTKYLHIECSHAWESFKRFYHAYDGTYSSFSPFIDRPMDEQEALETAVTLHHVKVPWIMHKLHRHFMKKYIPAVKMTDVREFTASEVIGGDNMCDGALTSFSMDAVFHGNGSVHAMAGPVLLEITQAAEIAYEYLIKKLVADEQDRLQKIGGIESVPEGSARKNLVYRDTTGYILEKRYAGIPSPAYIFDIQFTRQDNSERLFRRVLLERHHRN